MNPIFFVAASAVQQLTTERETTEAVIQCLNYKPDRRGGGGRKKKFRTEPKACQIDIQRDMVMHIQLFFTV